MKIDVLSSDSHYLAHIMPVYDALPERLKGVVHPMRWPVDRPILNHIALVGSAQDLSQTGQYRSIYVEHGAGQTYGGADENMATHPSYSGGGAQHKRVLGYIAPSQIVADRWDKPSVAVGCPKMDAWLPVADSVLQPSERLANPSVCLAFHWNCRLLPESLTAFHHYEPQIVEIVAEFKHQGFIVYGHAHPKWRDALTGRFKAAGVDHVLASDEDVFRHADVLVMDNSSLMYEMAMLGRTVIALNMPQYRRDVEHGLRFWSHVPGLQVDDAEQLVSLDLHAVLADPDSKALGRQAVEHAYAYTDGTSSQRAAEFITQLVDNL